VKGSKVTTSISINNAQSIDNEHLRPKKKIYNDFCIENFNFTNETIEIFKDNVKYLCKITGSSLRSLFEHINSKGVRLHRSAFLENRPQARKLQFTVLYVATFARVFDVPVSVIFSEDIATDYKNYKEKQAAK